MRAMKNSGIEWIGEIPANWHICKLKNVATIITGNTPSKANGDSYYADEGMMWVKPDNLIGTTPITATNEYLSSEGIEMARIVPPNTPLVCCIGSIGKIGFSDKSVAFNQQINAVDYNENVDRRYGLYYLISQEEQHKMRANGNVLPILNSEQQGSIPFLLPPLQVQTNIALYLDKKCAEIDALIAAKERTNALLRERRQSIIYEAVTKGLDPSVPMKDSGIEWIGEIPQHWLVERLKFHIDFNSRTEIPEYEEDDSVSFIPMDCLRRGVHTSQTVDYSKVKSGYVVFADGDILMAKVTPCLENGNLAIATDLIDGVGFGSTEINVIRCKSIHKEYLFYILQCKTYVDRAVADMYGVAGLKRLNPSFIPHTKYPMPSVEEQKTIAEYLNNTCEEIDTLISANEATIQKLKEYRQSIIYEAVTGKMEV